WTNAVAQARAASGWMPWSSEPWRLRAEAEIAQGFRAAGRRSVATALEKDPRDWRLWFDLARASGGTRQRIALGRAFQLNPLNPALRRSAKRYMYALQLGTPPSQVSVVAIGGQAPWLPER